MKQRKQLTNIATRPQDAVTSGRPV